MTCFRMKNGMTLLMACRATGLSYHSVYKRLENGMQPEDAFWDALKNKGNRQAHAKYIYNGIPLTIYLNHDVKKYSRIVKRIKRGMPIAKAVELEF